MSAQGLCETEVGDRQFKLLWESFYAVMSPILFGMVKDGKGASTAQARSYQQWFNGHQVALSDAQFPPRTPPRVETMMQFFNDYANRTYKEKQYIWIRFVLEYRELRDAIETIKGVNSSLLAGVIPDVGVDSYISTFQDMVKLLYKTIDPTISESDRQLYRAVLDMKYGEYFSGMSTTEMVKALQQQVEAKPGLVTGDGGAYYGFLLRLMAGV